MKYVIRFIALMLLFTVTPVVAQDAGETLDNLDFETGTPGQTPPGWSWPKRYNDEGFSAQLTDEDAHGGRQSVVLAHTDLSKGGYLGTLSKNLDATPYRGKRVRLRAAVRAQVWGRQGHARLWLRIDREGGVRGFSDDMEARPITDRAWRFYEIVGDVAADAESVHFGTVLVGYGKSWTDDVTFEVIGETPALVVEPPRPATERGLANLRAFTQLLGYVRYFHPSDEAAEADWETFAIAGIRAVE